MIVNFKGHVFNTDHLICVDKNIDDFGPGGVVLYSLNIKMTNGIVIWLFKNRLSNHYELKEKRAEIEKELCDLEKELHDFLDNLNNQQ